MERFGKDQNTTEKWEDLREDDGKGQMLPKYSLLVLSALLLHYMRKRTGPLVYYTDRNCSAMETHDMKLLANVFVLVLMPEEVWNSSLEDLTSLTALKM